jgi:tRNA-modifying protein YgfZ
VTEPMVFDRSPWGLVVVSGPDATSFLQAIVSQDLDPVDDGDTVESLLLHPQGKLDVAFRATKHGERRDSGDVWWLDTDPAFGPHLAEALGRYKIRVKVEIEDRTAQTGLASVVGETVWSSSRPPAEEIAQTSLLATDWGGTEGVDVLGPVDEVRAWIDASGILARGRMGTAEELEALRIGAGIPRLGVDVDDSTIPQEAHLEVDAVSFTKGCFIGQELVCRIDSRGHVNRFLRRLSLPGTRVPPSGADVARDDKVVGNITSATTVPGEDRIVALAMVRREVEPPAEVAVRWDGGESPAVVLA